MKYKRVVLKLSGEALSDKDSGLIFNGEKLHIIAKMIADLSQKGIQIGVVIGAGNIFRGKISSMIGAEQIEGDYMGMLGTVINCLALSSALEQEKVKTKVFSAINIDRMTTPYDYKKARKHLEKGHVVLFAGGTGNPYFTTDTCATLRALEVKADAILMAKNGVEGVYDSDPRTNKNAKFLKNLTYDEVLERNLGVMDQTAIAMLKGKHVEVKVFSMDDLDNFKKVIMGEDIGSTIKED